MDLLTPLGLAFLSALPLIVILHLLRDRRPRVQVASLALWRNLQRRTAGPRRRRLPLTWVLAAQLALATLLACALTQPFSAWLAAAPAHTIILLDTSASMAATDLSPSRFARARDGVRDTLERLRGEERVTLITIGPHATRLGTAGPSERAALAATLATLTPGGVGSDLAGALALANAAYDPTRRNRIEIYTDGALGATDVQTLPPALAPVTWRFSDGDEPNEAIIVFNATQLATGEYDVFARVAHYGNATGLREVELYVDDQRVDRRAVPFQPDSDVSLTWSLPATSQTVRISLRGQDALPADDQATLTLAPPAPWRVTLVSAAPTPGDALALALQSVPGIILTRIAPADYTGQSSDVTVFEGYLPPTWPQTGSVLVLSPPHTGPGQRTALTVIGAAPAGRVQAVPDAALMRHVDLSGVAFADVLTLEAVPDLRVAAYAGENPLILYGPRTADHPALVLCAFDLTQSTLPARIAFPLLIANALATLTPTPLPATLPAGQPLTLGMPDATQITLTTPDGTTHALPADQDPLVLHDTLQPGLYTLAVTRTDGTLYTARFAVQTGAAGESDLRSQPIGALRIAPRPPAQQAPAPNALGLWLAAAALLMLIVEGWLIWRR